MAVVLTDETRNDAIHQENARDIFVDILLSAKEGDEDALLAMLKECEPLVRKYAKRNGRIDQDLKQHLLIDCIRAVKIFDPLRHLSNGEEESSQHD